MPEPLKEPISITSPSSAIAGLLHAVELVEQQLKYKICYGRLDVGDSIKVGTDTSVIIDQAGTETVVAFGKAASSKSIPLNKAIRGHFLNLLADASAVDQFAIQHGIKSDRHYSVPLSTFLNERTGNCATMAIMFQLFAQERGSNCFCIMGTIDLQGDGAMYHAWNITNDLPKGPMLCDVAQGLRGRFEGIVMREGFPDLETPSLTGVLYSLV
jgi:hypothetical protein